MLSSTAITRGVATLAAATALMLAGCSSSGNGNSSSSNSSSSQTASQSGVDQAARALLPAGIRSSGNLTIADSLDYPPFEYKTTSGQDEGLDIDLIEAFARVLGVHADIIQVPFDGMIAGVASNRFDVAWGTFNVTPAREQQVNFVEYLAAGTAVSVLKGSAASQGITDASTLCGHTVAVQIGAVQQTQVAALSKACTSAGKPAISVLVFTSPSTEVEAIVNGRAAAGLDNSTTSNYDNKATDGKVVSVGPVFDFEPNGFCLAKNEPTLLKASQAAMQFLIDNGTYAQILQKWGESKNAVTKAQIYM